MDEVHANKGGDLLVRTVAYFGHDVSDAAVRRRILALEQDGLGVIGFTKRRSGLAETSWDNVDLGKTKDGAFLQRIVSVFSGAYRTRRAGAKLKSTDIIIARNLDMLACALLGNWMTGARLPVVYECLDVHRLTCRDDVIGSVLRRLESWMMSKTKGLIVSSPAFLTEHFEKHYGPQERVRLVENRIVEGMVERPDYDLDALLNKTRPDRLRLGWVGILRCNRSLDTLCQLAEMYRDDLTIELHGIPARTEVPDFENRIAHHPNIYFHGRYKSPEDLEKIYGGLDLVWSIDFMEAGLNSVWLLPNRIYEGGLFSVPSIALKGTQTDKWLSSKGVGFAVDEPLLESVSQLVGRLIKDRDPIAEKQAAFSLLEDDVFIQPAGFIKDVVKDLLS